MSDDDLDLLEGDLWRSQGQKHGLIINVGPHRQWPYSENTSGNGNLDQSGGYGNSDMILAEKHEARMAFTNHANHIYLGPSDDAIRKTSSSIIEGLLTEIYDRGYQFTGINRDSVDSDTTFTEYSSTCETRLGASVGAGGGVLGVLTGAGGAGGIASPKLLINCDSLAQRQSEKSQRSYMKGKSVLELRAMIAELQHRVAQTSSRLVRLLKKKDKMLERQHNYCDIITASLQAASLKRNCASKDLLPNNEPANVSKTDNPVTSIASKCDENDADPNFEGVDTRIKFSITPLPGKRGFRQWHDALRAMCRLPSGIPRDLRRKVWLCLADHYLKHVKVDWDKTVRYTFNDRSNPDDEKLGVQIVKDLHRTGYSGFSSGEGAEAGRALLKRVLLAYARWNKQVGYCQGFNVLAATLLQVCEGNEVDALKLMIYLIDRVLPQNYFSHNLRALSVDMAVFRDLLRSQQPTLSAHFDKLQSLANSVPYSSGAATGSSSVSHHQSSSSAAAAAAAVTYEPPLTNVFTMQWFLTLFATCLPKPTVLRVWDCIFLEGSEMLLRVALAVWENISERILQVETADEFYSLMANIQSEMFEYNLIDCETLIQTVYSMGPSPFTNLSELREKYTYNITPFSPMHPPSSSHGGKGGSSSRSGGGGGGGGVGGRGGPGGGSSSSVDKSKQSSDDEDDCDAADRAAFMRCFPNFYPSSISLASPAKCSKDVYSGDESGGSGTAINQTGGIGSSSIGGHGGADSLLNASPGAYSSPSDPTLPLSAPLERMSTDIHALKKQYSKLQQRMQQVHVIYYGGRTSADGSVSEKPVEVVNPMKTNLAINHLFVVNKDQTTSQLPVLPPQSTSTSPTPSATGTGANSNATVDATGAWGMSGCVGYNSCSSQAVNHLTIKPYIPHASTLDPLASSPLPCPCPPHASSSPAPSESSAGGGAPLTSNSSSLSPLSSKNNSTSHSHHPTSRSTAAVAASQRRRKSQQTQSASTSPRSTCSSPGGQAVLYPRKRSEAGASTIDSLDVDEEGVGGGFGAIGDDIVLPPVDTLSCSFCLNNNSQPHPETTPTTDCCSCSTRTWPTPSSCDTTEDATTAASAHSFSFSPTEFTSPPATPPTGSCSSTSFSSPSSRAAASKNVYRKAPLKPNIRPNLGSNDRPRIYNPFPVNYVHNTKLRKGKSLGLYCQSSTAQSSNSSTSSNKLNTGGSGGASTASDGVLARLGLK